MNTKRPIEEIIFSLIGRSHCGVQMAAVVVDKYGIVSWGWNSANNHGKGEHAEESALRRANRQRLAGATIYVAGRHSKSGNIVHAAPCAERCQHRIIKHRVATIKFLTKEGTWNTQKV